MAAALIYKPAPRWPLVAAGAAAVLIHVGAIAVAAIRTPEPVTGVSESGVIIDVVEDARADVAEPAAPDEVPLPSPPVDSDEPVFAAPAVPVQPKRTATPARPLVTRAAPRVGGANMIAAARLLAIVAPRPEYPYEARRQHLTGSGVATLSVDFASGIVVDAAMTQSTGNAVLDDAAIAAFRRWRFKPGTVSRVQTPITSPSQARRLNNGAGA